MLAHALLAAHDTDQPAPAGMIALTYNEIRRLFTVLIIEPGRVRTCPEVWSDWRRRHQDHAAPATTNARKQLSAGHNDLPLEY